MVIPTGWEPSTLKGTGPPLLRLNARPLVVTDMKSYEFICPACDQRIPVDGAMRDIIMEKGCPVCSASADADCFGAP